MKRWLLKQAGPWLAGGMALALVLGTLSGCGQQTFLAKDVYDHARGSLLPPKLEQNQCGVVSPLTDFVKAPATVPAPERPPRHLTLQEAVAIALENGLPSNQSGIGNGVPVDNLTTFTGAGSLNAQTDRIRVLALNPAISGSAIEAALARFDAVWTTSMSWTSTDAIPGVPNLPGYLQTVSGQTAQFQSSIVKGNAAGGVANVSFLTDYRNLNNASSNPFAFGLLNPQYSSRLSFGYEQPLWRDWGSDINGLLARFPAITGLALTSQSAQIGFNQEQARQQTQFADRAQEGILISRLRLNQNRVEFERNLHVLLLNTEVAYWTLYSKYGQLYSFEENLRILQKAWQESYNGFKAGKTPPELYYQIFGQYEEFRGERVRAMEEVLDAERNLRGILGMPTEDGTRLIPISPPTLAELKPDWGMCLQEALNLRPELILARENLKYHQYLLGIQKNSLKPDLRAYARYEPFGDGSALTGNGTFVDASGQTRTTNSYRSLASGALADYQVGLFLNVPLGFRFENSAARAARLELAQSYYFLRDQEDKATRYLTNQYQDLAHWYQRIEAHRAERHSYQASLRALSEQIKAGKILLTSPGATVQVLQVQRSYAAALVKEYTAIASYNSSMAKLEFAKGGVLRYNNVHIGEGQVPQVVEELAVKHERDRTNALVLKTRPDSLTQPGRLCASKESDIGVIPSAQPELVIVPPSPGSVPNQLPGLPMPQKLEGASPKEIWPVPNPKTLPDSLQSPQPKTTEPAGPALLPVSGMKTPDAAVVTVEEQSVTPHFQAKKEAAPMPVGTVEKNEPRAANPFAPASNPVFNGIPLEPDRISPPPALPKSVGGPPMQPDWEPTLPPITP